MQKIIVDLEGASYDADTCAAENNLNRVTPSPDIILADSKHRDSEPSNSEPSDSKQRDSEPKRIDSMMFIFSVFQLLCLPKSTISVASAVCILL